MQVLGFIIGTAIWTTMIGSAGPRVTWIVVAVGAALGLWSTMLLRPIEPGQDLETVSA